jgi:hypothetical protein
MKTLKLFGLTCFFTLIITGCSKENPDTYIIGTWNIDKVEETRISKTSNNNSTITQTNILLWNNQGTYTFNSGGEGTWVDAESGSKSIIWSTDDNVLSITHDNSSMKINMTTIEEDKIVGEWIWRGGETGITYVKKVYYLGKK